jgi:DNA-binding NarL/FixJ family response regulator
MNPLNEIPEQEPSPENKVTMTPREIEIVRAIAEGRTTREVADALGIAVNTVEVNRHNIIKKLGCRHMSHVVFQFCKAGLI